jgi:endonuclease/exonuclease/phosphatase family metal-dependent hydrolase
VTADIEHSGLRVATLNVGLLRMQIGRFSIFEPVPRVAERMVGLPRFLRTLGVDVLALQEVFVRGYRRQLVHELAEVFPHAAAGVSHSWMGNGLITLSRHPIEVSAFQRFRHDFLMVRPFATFGLLHTRIRRPGGATLEFFNTHLTAGPFGDPERARVEAMRDRQIQQLIGAADAVAEKSAPVIVAGDFNAGPGVSEANYRRFAEADFGDAFVRAERRGSALEATWTPENTLTRSGPHSTSPPQRIDHVFLRGVADDAVVQVTILETTDPTGEPLSDHRVMIAESRLPVSDPGSSNGANSSVPRS